MICVSIQGKTLDEIFAIVDRNDVEMAEIRLDRCELSFEEIETLFSCTDKPLIATCRFADVLAKAVATEKLKRDVPELSDSELKKAENSAVQQVESVMMWAIDAGATYVDIEIDAPPMMAKRLRRKADDCGSIVIRSFHDYEGTDSLEALKAVIERCRNLGAEIIKIAVTPHSEAEMHRAMGLYSFCRPGELVAFCMGKEWSQTRIDCLRKGAPYTYAALSEDEATAEGQMSLKVMNELIYSKIRKAYGGQITMPASKSFAQRAILAAAIADGTSSLTDWSSCGDTEAAVNLARAIGADVSIDGSNVTITGIGGNLSKLQDNLLKDSNIHLEYNVGESGLLARLAIPLLSLTGAGIHLTGEKTLLDRPLDHAGQIMRTLGVSLRPDTPNRGSQDVKVPLTISGKICPGNYTISGKDGSQIISGILMAMPMADGDTEIHISSPRSIPYIFITLDVLHQFGIRVENEMEGGKDFAETQDWQYCTGMDFRIKGGQKYKPAKMAIEGDWSAAANFFTAAAIFGGVSISGLDTKSLQADLSIIDILTDAGASISQMGEDDSKGNINVCKAPLKGFRIDASNCPDLFPILAVLAAFCSGQSYITGVSRLRNKECDRAKAILDMLTQMGVPACIKSDVLTVSGMPLGSRILNGKLLKGGRYTSMHDHRMVMALSVAGLGADSPIEIDDTECVAKSYPGFFENFAKFTDNE